MPFLKDLGYVLIVFFLVCIVHFGYTILLAIDITNFLGWLCIITPSCLLQILYFWS